MKPLVMVLALLMAAACSDGDRVQTFSGAAQGTTWNVRVWQPGGADLTALRGRVEAELDRLDASLSNYRPDSGIERFNRAETTAPVTVDAEIVGLVQTARQVSEASEGCYDLTIKPLFDLWGFTGDTLTPPDPDHLARVRERVGFARLDVPSPTQLRKADPGIRVDLSSIAQGYSVGRIAAVVEAAGIQHYLVEIGGELQTRGHKPGGVPWRIGVERPMPGGRGVQKALTIRQDAPVSIMTSGTYRHYYDDRGRRYSHVLDARSGRPVAHDTISVTVIDDDPALADAWSTALLCLGSGEGLASANRHGIAALFMLDKGSRFEELATDAWQSLTTIEVN